MQRLLFAFTLAIQLAFAHAAEPIRIGVISSLSGDAPIAESLEGLRAYIDSVNQAGGIQGRPVSIISYNDEGDPARARELAKKLVESDKVVALVGGASIVDCAANGAYYRDKGIVSLPGTGVEDACFNSPAIAPVNAGPYASLATALKFTHRILEHRKSCLALVGIPGMERGFRQEIDKWTTAMGKQTLAKVVFFPPADPADKLLREFENAGCDAFIHVGFEKSTLDILNLGPAWLKKIDVFFMTPAYTATVAKFDTRDWKGVYVMSEFMPWTSADLPVREWKELMRLKKVPLSSLSQGGYIAARVFHETASHIKGDITRESVTAKLQEGERIENRMLGAPFQFGRGSSHNPNRQTIPLTLTGNAWRIAYFNWLTAGE